MRLLLDTHALIWWLAGDARLSVRARDAIDQYRSLVFVSAASAWEIATKVRIGKLPGAAAIARDFKREQRVESRLLVGCRPAAEACLACKRRNYALQ